MATFTIAFTLGFIIGLFSAVVIVLNALDVPTKKTYQIYEASYSQQF